MGRSRSRGFAAACAAFAAAWALASPALAQGGFAANPGAAAAIDPSIVEEGEQALIAEFNALRNGLPASQRATLDAFSAQVRERLRASPPVVDVYAATLGIVQELEPSLTPTEAEGMANYALIDFFITVGADAQFANPDMQNALQMAQQYLQTLSNISKMTHDGMMNVIRKIGG